MSSTNDQQKTEQQPKQMMCGGPGTRAPRHVYTCVIKNKTNEELTCEVEYRGIDDKHTEVLNVQIPKGEEQKINEKTFEHDSGTSTGRKTVHRIHVKKYDGKTIEIKEPFENVTSPQQNWEFHINDNEIKSVNPNQ
ncbi:unnamed protein product [Didymodactylos carnosus]|uniref:Uncharacterized protein n=2 Tax=Didymodactylos carnosus TaxID=1234261 RepID=A0A815T3T9_9BILA|nr:unnamed protein product [Didymodactylos carnosus]CAF4360074.1 unnamed protein product [Didymodactylos carnosus]